MNYAKLFLLSILLSSLSISAKNVRLLQQAEINKKIAVIEKKIVRDNRIKIGIQAIAHAQQIYVFWTFVSPWFVNGEVKPLKPFCEVCKELAKTAPIETIPFTTALWSDITKFGQNVTNLFTTPQGWWTIGGWGVYAGSCIATLYVTLRMPHEFIHPDTLRWYVGTYAPYELTIQEMKEALMNLQDQSITAEQIANNRQLLIDSLNRLARYGESMCAYMAYKTKQLDEYEQPIAERAARYCFKYHNDWLMMIATECELEHPNADRINQLIAVYEKDIAIQLRHFYAVEGETKAERRAMRDRE